jgi:hypothetical protein
MDVQSRHGRLSYELKELGEPTFEQVLEPITARARAG